MTFFGDLPKIKNFMAQDYIRLEIQNTAPPAVLIRSEPNFTIIKAAISEYKGMRYE